MKKRGFDIERELVRRTIRAGGFAQRRPGSLKVDVLSIIDGDVNLISAKTTRLNSLVVSEPEIRMLLEEKARMRKALLSRIEPKAFVYVRRMIAPAPGQKGGKIEEFIEVPDSALGKKLHVKFSLPDRKVHYFFK